MGKTYRRNTSDYYDHDDPQSSKYKKAKQSGHSNNRRTQGMRILNDVTEDDSYDDNFDDEVGVYDKITINKVSGKSTR